MVVWEYPWNISKGRFREDEFYQWKEESVAKKKKKKAKKKKSKAKKKKKR